VSEQGKDLFDFKAVIYRHLDRILSTNDRKTFTEYVRRMLFILSPYAQKSENFRQILEELKENKDKVLTDDETDMVLAAISYAMQETELSPPLKQGGEIDDIVFKD